MNTPLFDAQKSTTQFLQGFQQLAQFNIELMQTSFADATKTVQILGTAKDPQEFAALCASQIKAAPEKVAGYGRQIRDILTPSRYTGS